MPLVEYMEAMNRIKSFIIAITVSLMLASFASDCLAQGGCSLLDKDRLAQFITYKSFSESSAEVELRFTNNTTCPVTVQTDDRSPTQIVRQPNGGVKIESVTESRDGITVPLHYLIQNKRGWRAPETGYGWGDSVYTYDVLAGQSVLFLVTLKHFKNRLDIIVPFKYVWESSGTIGMGIGGINHHVYFLVEDLPEEIIEKRD